MSNFTDSIDPDPESAVLLGIIYSVYIVLGIPANLLVLFITVTTKSIRAVPQNVCIFSLALADLIVLSSFISSPLRAMTDDVMICKVMGVGIYVSVVMSMMLPSCLAICRHAAICSDSDLHPKLRILRTRKGIIFLNMLYWTYGLSYPLPFVISDMFGLDGMGVCGIMEIDTAFLWSYYMVVVVGILFGAYAITFTFYRKLGRWETSSLMTLSEHTRETLIITRNLMRMMKWVLFIPVVFYYPGLTIEAALRLSPGSVATRTARFFMITVPLPHVLDPLVTIFFMKSYRTAVMNLLRGKAKVSAFSDPVQAVPHIGIMKK